MTIPGESRSTLTSLDHDKPRRVQDSDTDVCEVCITRTYEHVLASLMNRILSVIVGEWNWRKKANCLSLKLLGLEKTTNFDFHFMAFACLVAHGPISPSLDEIFRASPTWELEIGLHPFLVKGGASLSSGNATSDTNGGEPS
jgi:hypothetical protein